MGCPEVPRFILWQAKMMVPMTPSEEEKVRLIYIWRQIRLGARNRIQALGAVTTAGRDEKGTSLKKRAQSHPNPTPDVAGLRSGIQAHSGSPKSTGEFVSRDKALTLTVRDKDGLDLSDDSGAVLKGLVTTRA